MFTCGQTHQWKLKIQEQCLKHPTQKYRHFCTNKNCLEILCEDCIKPHRDAHVAFHEGEPEIYSLAEVESYFTTKQDNSIKYEEQYQKQKIKQVDPCQILGRIVDQYFYGSVSNKIENEKERNQQMKNPSAKKFIEILEKQSEYRISDTFKEKYFQFLDELLSEEGQK